MARRRCYASGSQAPAARTPALSIIDNQPPAAAPGLGDEAELRSHTGTMSSRSQQCCSLQTVQSEDQSASAVVETNRCDLWNV